MNPSEKVQQAFLHLCWSIKLDTYLELNPPKNKVDFDHPLTITDPTDPCFFPGDQFDTIPEILLGAKNSILLSVGALFLALDEALDEAGFSRNPLATDNLGQLRTLIYMCRCAFAHNVLEPHWEVRNRYCIELDINLPDISIQINLNQFANNPFNIKQIGGYSQLIKIIDYIIQQIETVTSP